MSQTQIKVVYDTTPNVNTNGIEQRLRQLLVRLV